MVHTDSFLCCFELETGGIFLGWFGIIVNVLLLITVPLFGSQFSSIQEAKNKHHEAANYLLQGSLGNYFISPMPESAEIEDAANVKLVLVIFCTWILLRLFASIILLIGTKKRNHQHVLVYLIIEGIIRTISMLSSLIWSPYFLVDIFWIYVSISTLSLYKKFEEESKERTNSQLTFVGTTFNHRLGQIGLQIKQNNGSSGYSQLASYQENFNLAESNQLPSYEKVCPSAPPK